MRRPPSLSLRLTLLIGIAAAITFFSFGWFIERSINRHFAMGDTDELNAIAHTVSQTLANYNAADTPLTLNQRFNDLLVGHHDAVLYIVDSYGKALFTSPGGPDLSQITASALGKTGEDTIQQLVDTHHTYRVLTRSLLNVNSMEDSRHKQTYAMSIAVVIDNHLNFINEFRYTLWLMIIGGISIMGLMGWFLVQQGHAPLRNIVAQIRRISANELNTRLSPDAMPDELTDLASSFNEMLGRMEEAFKRLSNFSDDIAHELRTPITSLLTQTQVALSQSRSLEEYREILYSNIDEYERMAQMVGDMLFLAKVDNRIYQPDNTAINLAEEVKSLFEYYEAWADERGVTLTLEGEASVHGDKSMIRRAINNLLANAIRHTPPESNVQIFLNRQSDNTTTISIENPGSAIPPEHLPRLFDRFYRVDASRQRSDEGTGLGLAIVKSIVEIHGGRVLVDSSEQSTRFTISLPKS